MPYEVVEWPFPNLGLNTELAPRHLSPQALSVLEDMFYPSPILLQGRGDFDALAGAANSAGDLVYYWDFEDALYHRHRTNNELYRDGVLATATHGQPLDMVSFGIGATPLLYIAEELVGGHTLHTWDGAVYANLAGANIPNVTRLMVRFSRLFGMGEAANPSRIYFSDVGDATVWAGAFDQGGYLDIAPGEDGDNLDWIEFRGILYVFKTHGLYRVLGDLPSTFRIERVGNLHDFLPGTVADVRQGIMYATRHGVYVLGQARVDEVHKVTGSIDQDFRRILRGANVYSGVYSPETNAYLLATDVAPIGVPGRIWVSNLNVRPDVWSIWHPNNITTTLYQGPNLYAVAAGIMYQYEHEDAGGSPKFKTGYWDFGDKVPLKHVQYIQGQINARDNTRCTVTPFYRRGGHNTILQPVESSATSYNLDPGERNLIRVNKNCELLSIQVEYGG